MLLLAALVLPGRASAAPQPQSGPSRITILPINRARLLVGQRFDFRVEVGDNLADNTDAGVISVTVDGKSIQAAFGKEATKSNTNKQSAQLTVRDVAFATAGTHTVTVVAGASSRTITYDVVAATTPAKRAKNVILFVGDGMTSEIITIARIVSKGLTEGRFNGMLAMDSMDEYGLVTTSGYDSLVTDSANSASAYATGNKSVVNAMGVYGDDTANSSDDPRVENIVELVKRTRNMAVGIVSTSEIEDATPAAMWGHTRRRADKQLLADQAFDLARRPDVILGGGAAYFLPKATPGSRRTDERDLLGDFRNAGYSVVGNRAEMNRAPSNAPLLGLFHPTDMNVYIDREQTRDPAVLGPYTDQPTLMEMTAKALDVLSTSANGKQNGFFLMVEGASIDKQLHPMDWERAAADTIEMDQSVAIAKDFASRNNDTLIVIVADHGHSVSVFGTYDTTQGPGKREAVGIYDQARFPTYRDADGNGFPDSWTPSRALAVGFGNRPDYRDDYIFNPRPISPTIVDPNNSANFIPNPARDPQGILLTGNLPLNSNTEVHSADDVPLMASGPGAAYFNGVHDNTDVFFGIAAALGLDATKVEAKRRSQTGGIALGVVVFGTLLFGVGRVARRRNPALRRVSRAFAAARRSFGAALRDE